MTRKHEANTQKSKWINIQLWIIAFLSFSYFMYEVHMYSEPIKDIADNTYTNPDDSDDIDEVYAGVVIYTEPKTVIKPILTAKPTEIAPVKVDNDTPEIKEVEKKEVNKPEIKTVPTNNEGKEVKTTINTSSKKSGESKKVAKKPYTTRTVDFLPVFPGCDKYSTNDERAACFQKKIERHINRKFNNGLGEELGLKGRQRISLYFEIDKNGNISNVRARSAGHIIDLEKEAIRVAKKLPKMEPARAGNNKVKMSYTMPIVFDAR